MKKSGCPYVAPVSPYTDDYAPVADAPKVQVNINMAAYTDAMKLAYLCGAVQAAIPNMDERMATAFVEIINAVNNK